jgi:hypothetical protein
MYNVKSCYSYTNIPTSRCECEIIINKNHSYRNHQTALQLKDFWKEHCNKLSRRDCGQVKGNQASQDMTEMLHDVTTVVKHLAPQGRGTHLLGWVPNSRWRFSNMVSQLYDTGLPSISACKSDSVLHDTGAVKWQSQRATASRRWNTCHCVPGARIFIGTAQNTHHQILKAF